MKMKPKEEINGDMPKHLMPEDRISIIEEVVAALVFKLKDPLSSVMGYADLLSPKINDPESKEELEGILQGAERISQIIREFTLFSIRKEPKKEAIDLNKLIEMCIEMKAEKLNLKNIKIFKDMDTSLPRTQADMEQVRYVILHLISNSEEIISKYHGLGEIRIKTRTMGDRIEIVFSDDGPGVPEENLSKIFDPFFSTEKKGLGLGLSNCYMIIASHGGTINAESEWGHGTTFTITLPIINIEEEKKKGEEVEKSLKGLKGLIIDDDISIITLTSRYLKNEGCEIETVQNVKDALNIIEGKEFDFVICDIRMPEMGGDDFYRIVGERKPRLKDRIILMTGDVMGKKTRAFISSTKNLFIEKPFNLNELKKVIIDLQGRIDQKEIL